MVIDLCTVVCSYTLAPPVASTEERPLSSCALKSRHYLDVYRSNRERQPIGSDFAFHHVHHLHHNVMQVMVKCKK